MLATEVQEKFPEEHKIWKENPDKLRMLVQNGEETQEFFSDIGTIPTSKRILARNFTETSKSNHSCSCS